MPRDAFKHYVVIPTLIGVITGLFAILFVYGIEIFTTFFLKTIVGYYPPLPAGEGETDLFTPRPERPYLLPFVVALAGFLVGWLAYKFSPESAGVGTDAAIKAYHSGERLSFKDAIVKLITSAITIGAGGTSGREGPIALIGASLGSTIGEILKLDEKRRREALAIGLGAGIAAIFKAPFAGAIISAEVFFKRDFVIEYIIPGFVASSVAYSIFGMHFGFQPIFHTEIPPFKEEHLSTILAYIGLGLLTALVVRIYLFIYYTVGNFFKNLRYPLYVKSAIGGFIAGLIGVFVPYAIGNGYGWLQLIMDGKITDYTQIALGALGVILGVSFTLGSGMSGGVFGPSVMIGGLLGAAYSLFLNQHYGLSLNVQSFTIVGMVSLFAGAAKAPLSTIILIAEMTGGYELLVPAMITVFISYFLSGEKSIFPSQVNTRLDSPAHQDECGLFLLEKFKVKEFMTPNPVTVHPEASLEEAQRLLTERLIGGLPVTNGKRVVGIITKSDIAKVPPEARRYKKVREVMSDNVITLTPEEPLSEALRIISTQGVGRIPVVMSYESRIIIGIITRADIGKAIRKIKRTL